MVFECNKPDGKPCRIMETRRCPISRQAGCPDEPCARFESQDESVWALDLIKWRTEEGR